MQVGENTIKESAVKHYTAAYKRTVYGLQTSNTLKRDNWKRLP